VPSAKVIQTVSSTVNPMPHSLPAESRVISGGDNA